MNSLLLALFFVGQAPEKRAAEFLQDFRAYDLKSPDLRIIANGVTRDDEGVRVTLPAGQGVVRPTGLFTTFRIRGDFEATLDYQVLCADRPDRGYGVGVSLYGLMDDGTNNAISMARRFMPNGRTVFVANLKKHVSGQAHEHSNNSLRSSAPTGKLRLARTGSIVRYLSAEGEENFVPVTEMEVGAGDVRFLTLGGSAGNSDAGLDIRLLKFSIRADALPGRPGEPREALPVVRQVPETPDAPPPQRSQRLWRIVVAAMVFVVLLTAVAAWWLSRWSARPGKRPVED